MAGLALGLLLPSLAGYCVVRAAWPVSMVHKTRTLRACIGAGFGLGLSSAVFFLASVMWSPSFATALGSDLVLLLASVGLLFRVRAGASKVVRPAGSAGNDQLAALSGAGGFAPAFRVLWLALLLVAALLFVARTVNFPHGAYDAWASWNMRARFMYRGGSNWRDMFDPLLLWTSPRYPLMMPGSVAKLWFYAGRDMVAAPIALAAVFSLGTVGTLGYGLDALRRRAQGRFMATLLLATPVFAVYAAFQYADVIFGFYLLCVLLLVCLSQRHEEGRVWLGVLAGGMAALAAWTKEEGQVAIAILFLAVVVGFLRTYEWRTALRRTLPLVVGLIPVGLVVLFFKVAFAPENPYLAGGHWLEQLTDSSRLALVGRGFFDHILGFGEWNSRVVIRGSVAHAANGWFSVTVLLVVLVVLAWHRSDRVTQVQRTTVVVALVGMIVLFTGAFLLTPLPLNEHIVSTLSRLLNALWPTALLLVGLSIGFGLAEEEATAPPVPVQPWRPR